MIEGRGRKTPVFFRSPDRQPSLSTFPETKKRGLKPRFFVGVNSSKSAQSRVLRLQLLQHGGEVGEPRLLLLHHGGGGTVDEAGVS